MLLHFLVIGEHSVTSQFGAGYMFLNAMCIQMTLGNKVSSTSIARILWTSLQNIQMILWQGVITDFKCTLMDNFAHTLLALSHWLSVLVINELCCFSFVISCSIHLKKFTDLVCLRNVWHSLTKLIWFRLVQVACIVVCTATYSC